VPVDIHAATLVWPVLAEYVPAGQFIHAARLVWPVLGEYVPAGQFIHVAILVAPVAEEYVPTGQFTQAPPLMYFPAGQAAMLQELAPAADVWPAGHGEQEAAPSVEKVFTEQFLQGPPAVEV
jgi:hypothetical protein